MITKNGMATEAFVSIKHMPETATDTEHQAWHVVAVKQIGPSSPLRPHS
jgi:hypothetical protein